MPKFARITLNSRCTMIRRGCCVLTEWILKHTYPLSKETHSDSGNVKQLSKCTWESSRNSFFFFFWNVNTLCCLILLFVLGETSPPSPIPPLPSPHYRILKCEVSKSAVLLMIWALFELDVNSLWKATESDCGEKGMFWGLNEVTLAMGGIGADLGWKSPETGNQSRRVFLE